METPIVTALIAAIVALATSLITFRRAEKRLQREFDLDKDKAKTGFMAEQVAKRLLEVREPKRTFEAIKNRLGGFEGNELRQILVRAGAVKFLGNDGETKLWGLLSKNKDDF